MADYVTFYQSNDALLQRVRQGNVPKEALSAVAQLTVTGALSDWWQDKDVRLVLRDILRQGSVVGSTRWGDVLITFLYRAPDELTHLVSALQVVLSDSAVTETEDRYMLQDANKLLFFLKSAEADGRGVLIAHEGGEASTGTPTPPSIFEHIVVAILSLVMLVAIGVTWIVRRRIRLNKERNSAVGTHNGAHPEVPQS